MWEVPLVTRQSETVVNNMLAQKCKLELAYYLHAALFSPTTESILKSIKQGFLKMWLSLTEKLIKKNLEKSRNITMEHMHMVRQGLQSTK